MDFDDNRAATDQCDVLKRRLLDAEKVLDNKNVLIDMLRDQLKQMEKSHKATLDIKEQLRLKCLRVEQDYNRYKKICSRLEDENKKLGSSTSITSGKLISMEKPLSGMRESSIEKLILEQNNVLKGFMSCVLNETECKNTIYAIQSSETLNEEGMTSFEVSDKSRSDDQFDLKHHFRGGQDICESTSHTAISENKSDFVDDICPTCGLNKMKVGRMEDVIREYNDIIRKLECEVQLLDMSIKKVNDDQIGSNCTCQQVSQQLLQNIDVIVKDKEFYRNEIINLGEMFRNNILKDKDNIIAKLKAELEKMSSNICEKESESDDLKKVIANMQLAAADITMQRDEAMNELNRLKSVLPDSDVDMVEKYFDNAKESVSSLQRTLNSLTDKYNIQAGIIHDQEHEIEHLRIEKDELKGRLQESDNLNFSHLGIDEAFLIRLQEENANIKLIMGKFKDCVDKYIDELGEEKCDCATEGGACAVGEIKSMDMKQKAHIKQLTLETQKYKDIILELKDALIRQNKDQDRAFTDNYKKDNEIRDLNIKLRHYQDEFGEMQNKLNLCRNEMKTCKDALDRYEQDINDCLNERQKLHEQLIKCKNQLQTYKRESNEAHDQLKFVKYELPPIKENMESMREQLMEYKNELAFCRKQLSLCQIELSEAQVELKTMQTESIFDKQQIKTLHDENLDMTEKLEIMNEDLMACKGKFSELKVNYENLMKASKCLKEQQVRCNKLLKLKECKMSSAIQEIERLGKELQETKNKSIHLEEEISRITKDNVALQNQLDHSLRQQEGENSLLRKSLENQVHKFKEVHQDQSKIMNDCHSELQRLKQALSMVNCENKDLKNNINMLNQEQEKLVKEKSECEHQISDIINNFMTINGDIDRMRSMLDKYKRMHSFPSISTSHKNSKVSEGTMTSLNTNEKRSNSDNGNLAKLRRENQDLSRHNLEMKNMLEKSLVEKQALNMEVKDLHDQANTYRVISQQLENEKDELLTVIDSMEYEVCEQTNAFIKQQTGDYDELISKYSSLKELLDVQEKIYHQKIQEMELQHRDSKLQLEPLNLCPTAEKIIKAELQRLKDNQKDVDPNDNIQNNGRFLVSYTITLMNENSNLKKGVQSMISRISIKIKQILGQSDNSIGELAQEVFDEITKMKMALNEQPRCTQTPSCNCINSINNACCPIFGIRLPSTTDFSVMVKKSLDEFYEVSMTKPSDIKLKTTSKEYISNDNRLPVQRGLCDCLRSDVNGDTADQNNSELNIKPDVRKSNISKTDVNRTDSNKTNVNKTEVNEAAVSTTNIKKTYADEISITKSDVNESGISKTDVNQSGISKTYGNKTDSNKADVNKTDVYKSGITKIFINKTDPNKTDVNQSGISKTYDNKTDSNKTEVNKIDVNQSGISKEYVNKTDSNKRTSNKTAGTSTDIDETNANETDVNKMHPKKIDVNKRYQTLSDQGSTVKDSVFNNIRVDCSTSSRNFGKEMLRSQMTQSESQQTSSKICRKFKKTLIPTRCPNLLPGKQCSKSIPAPCPGGKAACSSKLPRYDGRGHGSPNKPISRSSRDMCHLQPDIRKTSPDKNKRRSNNLTPEENEQDIEQYN